MLRKNSVSTVPVLKCPASIDTPPATGTAAAAAVDSQPAWKQLSDDQQFLLKGLKNMQVCEKALEQSKASTTTDNELEHNPSHNPDFFDDDYWLKHFTEFCSDACMVRYLRANQWNVDDAFNGLLKTLVWRRKYGPHLIRPSDIECEAVSGKQYINGFTQSGSTIIYFRPHRNQTKDYGRHIRYLVYTVEKAIELLPQHQEKLTLIFDFSQYSSASATPMNVSKYFLHLFASHYPERLGSAFACSAPWYFWCFYRIISPFIHPVTKSKIRFVDVEKQHEVKDLESEQKGIWSNLFHHVNPNMLESDFGGNFRFDYDHETYWTMITSTSEYSEE